MSQPGVTGGSGIGRDPDEVQSGPLHSEAERAAEERRAATATGEGWVAAAFGVAILASLALAAVYWAGGQPQWEGGLLAVALGAIGFGLVLWAKRFMPLDEVVEERPVLASPDEDRDRFWDEVERGQHTLGRRKLLTRMLGGAVAALGLAALFPIRSLGPRPGAGLKTSAWAPGRRAVDGEGRPVRASDVLPGAVLTVWPEGAVGDAQSPTLLVRPDPERYEPEEGREGWLAEGVAGFSKLCTHLGCPVGLYQSESGLLLCPCHQSTFDVNEACQPVFGPATRELPQLPLAIDGAGYLSSTGDFSAPPGASFWDWRKR